MKTRQITLNENDYELLRGQAAQEKRSLKKHLEYVLEQVGRTGGYKSGALGATEGRKVRSDAFLHVLPVLLDGFFATETMELTAEGAADTYNSFATATERYLVFDDFVEYVREHQGGGVRRDELLKHLWREGWIGCVLQGTELGTTVERAYLRQGVA